LGSELLGFAALNPTYLSPATPTTIIATEHTFTTLIASPSNSTPKVTVPSEPPNGTTRTFTVTVGKPGAARPAKRGWNRKWR
jgi:hypothetical protein